MKELQVKLENCYWIKKLDYIFDFEKSNVYSIYAPNGTMKTSFLKTFRDLEKSEEPKDKIYGNIDWQLKRETSFEILVDWNEINANQIFTIQSMDLAYKAENLKDLLINEDLKIKLDVVFAKRTDFLNYLNNKSWKIGLEIIENKLKEICLKKDATFLDILEDIELELDNYTDEFSDIIYDDIYSLEDKIKTAEFQNNIDSFISKNEEFYATIWNRLLSKESNFWLYRLKNVQKNLKKENFFFDNSNKIVLKWIELSQEKLDEDIKIIDKKIKESIELKEIEKLLSSVWWNKLKELIENSLIPIEKLKNQNREKFYNEIIFSYIKAELDKFNDLITSFKEIKEEIKLVSESDEWTLWKEVVDEFNQRFHVPFKMKISNVKSVILWESSEKIVFYFCDKLNKDDCNENEWIAVNSEENLKLILSQWEKRALYLLNILFEVKNKIRLIDKCELWQQLLIIDDIADSFDYKNKYAIIQYLKDLADKKQWNWEKYFNLIILTHNFDFYRTIQSRLWIYNDKNLYALKNEEWLDFTNWFDYVYAINNIIDWWQTCIYKYLSLIPVARNLVEYLIWKNESDLSDDNDYLALTSMLHSNWKKYCKWFLNSIYNVFLRFDLNENELWDIHELIISKCDEITDEVLTLDKKIVLSIWIRYEAEKYMNKKLWIKFWITKQIWKLYDEFRNSFNTDSNLKTLSDVVLMTPENIHINSFMYEPILDMSDWHLKKLYKKVKSLNENISN